MYLQNEGKTQHTTYAQTQNMKVHNRMQIHNETLVNKKKKWQLDIRKILYNNMASKKEELLKQKSETRTYKLKIYTWHN